VLPCLAGNRVGILIFFGGAFSPLRCDFRPIENLGCAEQQPAASAACSSKGVMRVCCGTLPGAAAELQLRLRNWAFR